MSPPARQAARAGMLAGTLVGAGTLAWNYRARQLATPSGGLGRLVDLAGMRVHVLAHRAEAGPTVVFENGLSCPCTEWAWVLRGIAGEFGYLAYDRPGNGWSDHRTGVWPAHEINSLTVALLAELGLPKPYVLVGHSLGGLLARTFCGGRPDQVAGMVLVDSSHPDQKERVRSQREQLSVVQHNISQVYWRTMFGMRPSAGSLSYFHELPEDVASATVEMLCHPAPWRGAAHDLKVGTSGWSNEARIAPIPSTLPVAVVTAAGDGGGKAMHAELQAELATLSGVSQHAVVPEAGHNDIVMSERYAGQIVKAIRWVAEVMK